MLLRFHLPWIASLRLFFHPVKPGVVVGELVQVSQGDLTGDMMDWISCATGYRRKELESVRAKRLTAPQVGSFGISTVWTRQGGTAQRRIRGPPIPLGT